MDFLYDWVKSIAIYMVLISVVKNLLPKSQFEKYLRLFTGMLVVILVIEPFSSWLNLQDTIDDLFSLDSYKQEMSQFQVDFSQLGDDFENQVLGGYEEQVRKQIALLLKEEGATVKRVEFLVCMEEGSADYGKLTRMEIYLGDYTGQEESQERRDAGTGAPKEDGTDIGIETPEIKSPFVQGYQRIEQEKLAEKICTYYQLERSQVEIYG